MPNVRSFFSRTDPEALEIELAAETELLLSTSHKCLELSSRRPVPPPPLPPPAVPSLNSSALHLKFVQGDK